MREERKQTLAADLERFNKAMREVEEDSDAEWGGTGISKQAEEDDSDFSDWEGPEGETEDSKPQGILKRKQFFEAEDDEEEDATVVIETMEDADSNFVFPEKSAKVLQQSLKKATFAAQQAALYGFPEPSIYRDEDGEDEDEEGEDAGECEVSFGPKKGKNGVAKPKQKKKKFRYLTKTERKANVSKERGRSKEKRTRAKK